MWKSKAIILLIVGIVSLCITWRLSWKTSLQLSYIFLSADLNKTLESIGGGLPINWTQTQYQMQRLSEVDSFLSENVMNRTGCHLPDLKPWDPAILEYVKDLPKVIITKYF